MSLLKNKVRTSSLSFLLSSLVFLLFPFVCFSVPFIDKETELAMGQQADKEIIAQYGLYSDKNLQLYVNEIGQKLVSKLSDKEFNKYFFKVVDSSEINAFALPGGYIYVTRGILATINSEAELAGILGHEIGHVTQHHGAKQIVRAIGAQILAIGGAIANPKNAGEWLLVSSQMFNQINLGYGRAAELESDAHGLLTAYQAGYDPRSMVDFLKGLRQHEMMSGQAYHSFQATHPDTKERIIKTGSLSESIINRHGLNVLEGRSVKTKRLEYLNQIRGLSFGGKKHRGDRKNYKEKYIDIYEVQPGDTFQSIATKELGDEREDLTIAVMNGKRLEDSLKPGEFLKLVRPGSYHKDTILEIRPDIDITQ
jgi:predicted Zn-dependent protease